jgi:pimeloyl-ACP methyl ester carboxylesterase
MTSITTTDGTRLTIDAQGAGPPVVLTHGWVLGAASWEPVASRLASAGLGAVAVDRRGCGRSDRPAAGYDLDTLADDLNAVLDALDLREVTLVAHSFGGAEAVRMLARHGADRVGRLVLVATTTPGSPPEQQPSQEMLDAALADLRSDRPAYVRAGAPGFFGDPPAASQATVEWGLGLALGASMAASVGLMETLLTTDVAADVAACPVPTLVVHGDADTSAPLELTGEPTAALLPDARLEVYPGAPHGLPLTHAERLAADVVAFARAAAGV